MLTHSRAGCVLLSMLKSTFACQASLHLSQSALACLVQNDLHSPQATIKEALWFSARLRLGPEVSNKVMWGFIYQVGAVLHLAHPNFWQERLHVASLQQVLLPAPPRPMLMPGCHNAALP